MHDLTFLFCYWILFWWKFLKNPYLLCTSEIASTNFPFWSWMGRRWQLTDSLYYKYPACIPFLSMWYPPNVIAAFIGRFLNEDLRFKFYVYSILSHYLLASFIAYKVFGLFGALTLTYAGYCIKPQTPSFVFTMCWIPGMFLEWPLNAISASLAILGGYWPILVYLLPIVSVMSFKALFVGITLALPQIFGFLWYWPKSVRAIQVVVDCGKAPFLKFLDLIRPTSSVAPTNGVHYPEVEMYMGIAPFFIFHPSWWWIPLVYSVLTISGILKPIQRIPARCCYLMTLSICFLSHGLKFPLVLIQAFLLLRNASIYPSFPFSQWWRKPDDLYPDGDYTGYLTDVKKNDYKGAFSLR